MFEIVLSLDDHYMFTVQQRVRNTGATPVTLYPWSRIRRDYTPVTAGYYILHEGMLGVLDGRLKETKYSEAKTEGEKNKGVALTSTGAGGWAGFTDKYWLTALIPDQASKQIASFRHISLPTAQGTTTDAYQVDFLAQEPQVVAPGATATQASRMFAGAKEVRLLDPTKARTSIPSFDKAVDFGWFYFLTKPFFYALDWLNAHLRQFRSGDPGVHRLHQGAVLPAGQQILPLDEQDEAARPEDDGAARAVQGRAGQAAIGDDGALQDREGEPGQRLPADGDPDPGVLLALQGDLHHHRDAPGAVLRLDPRPVGGRPDQRVQPVRPAAVRPDHDPRRCCIWASGR